MKRVISLVLCLMLVACMATTAFAVDVINNSNHKYMAYQIFAGTDAQSFSEWGSGIDGDKLLEDLKESVTYGGLFAHCDSSGDVASVLLQYPDYDRVASYFANVAEGCTKDGTGYEIAAGATTADLPEGYYLLVDQTPDTQTGDFVHNPALLQLTTKGAITLNMKVEKPKHEKNILTTDDQGDHNHTTVEDYHIGDKVEFHLRAELPVNVRDFDKFHMVFHDSMSAGLDFVNDPEEFYITVTYSKYFADTKEYKTVTETLVYGQDYTVVAATAENNPLADCAYDEAQKQCDVHFVIDDVFDFMTKDEACDAIFIVSYKATLNDEAVVNNPTNNVFETNDYRLEYSNNPNWEVPEGDGDKTPPAGITPWDDVKVYTTELVVNKIDGLTGEPLTGAEFTLTGTKTNRVKVEGMWFVPYEDDNYDAANKYWLLKDGTYTAIDPNGAEIDDSSYADTLTVYKKVENTDVLSTEEDVSIKAYVNSEGKLVFSGLGEGHYTITETVVPAGYNAVGAVGVTIMFDEKNGTYEYQWDGGDFEGNEVTIANYSGNELPETGGIGTTLFYVIGGLLVAGSAVLLITKKRMSVE